MPFVKPLPHWEAPGIEPPLSLRQNGWRAGVKPPDEYFNHLQNKAYEALKELQEYAVHKDDINFSGLVTDEEFATHLVDDSAHVYYADDTGTANAKVLTIPEITSYKKGMAIAFTNLVASTGAVTINVNGLGAIPVTKSNGSVASLKANIPYTVRHNGTAFILQGEGGEYGDATEGDVLKGKTIGTDEGLKTGTLELSGNVAAGQVLTGQTFYSTNPKTKQTGTMPNFAGISPGINGIPANGVNGANKFDYDVLPPKAGYYDTNSKIHQTITNLIPSNIRAGVLLPELGFSGTLTAAAMGGATRLASGTVLSSSSRLPFRKISDWSVTTDQYHASVSLDFEPDIIHLMWHSNLDSGVSHFSTYINNHIRNPKAVLVGFASYYTTGGEGRASVYKADSDNAYVNATGFRLPVLINNYSYSWAAIKF